MLDKRKIRLMTKMAIYEKEYGEEDIKISGYYKKDYSSLNTWITLIWITVGYLMRGRCASGKAYYPEASDICHNCCRRLFCPADYLRCGRRTVLQEKTYAGETACKKILQGYVPA